MSGNALLDILLLAVPAAIIGLWWTGTRAKELATDHARKACQREQVQFLDATVAIKRYRLARSSSGSTCLRRDYRFEFTNHGAHRDYGGVSMRGHELLRVEFPYKRDAEGNRVYQQ